MATIQCKNCGKRIIEKEETCPHCGEYLQKANTKFYIPLLKFLKDKKKELLSPAIIPLEKECSFCSEIIKGTAKKCKHCGEYQVEEKQTRQMGLLLGIGVLIVPYLFSWFTLRNGYSVRTKILSFTWLIIFIIISINGDTIRNTNNYKEKVTTTIPAKDTVYNSSWDGSVSQVKSWMNSHIKDPDSLEYIFWSKVKKIEKNGTFKVRVKYRAKNSFGGFVVEDKIFSISASGLVTGNINY